MSDRATYSESVLRYREALVTLKTTEAALVARNKGLSASMCLIICVLYETSGRTYRELSDMTGIGLTQVVTDCRRMTKMGMRKRGLVVIEEPDEEEGDAEESRIYLSPNGVKRHAAIIRNT